MTEQQQLHAIHSHAVRIYRERVSPPTPDAKLSHYLTQRRVYQLVASSGDGITNKDICTALDETASRVWHITDQLYRDGLIERQRIGRVYVFFGRAN